MSFGNKTYVTIDNFVEDTNSPFLPATVDAAGDNPLTIPDGAKGIRFLHTTAAPADLIEITRTAAKGAGHPIGPGETVVLFSHPADTETLWVQRLSGVNPSLPVHVLYFF